MIKYWWEAYWVWPYGGNGRRWLPFCPKRNRFNEKMFLGLNQPQHVETGMLFSICTYQDIVGYRMIDIYRMILLKYSCTYSHIMIYSFNRTYFVGSQTYTKNWMIYSYSDIRYLHDMSFVI